MFERDLAVSGQGQPAERDAGSAPTAPSENDGLGLRGALVAGVLAIAGLSSLAFAQPIYDVLRRAPEFFAIRDLYMADLAALIALLALGPALVLCAPAIASRFLFPAGVRAAAAVSVGLLVAIVALQALNGLTGPAALATALAIWVGGSVAYLRFAAARSFGSLLSTAAIVVPAILVLDGDVRSSATRPNTTPGLLPDTGARAPIVLVIFDEWSLTSILGAEGTIDRERFPNLAALADQATWYPNATAAADKTDLAIPAMLTGSKPVSGQLPTVAGHPVNLFTLLASSHNIYAAEPITGLCPREVNLLSTTREPIRERLSLLSSDLALIWLSITLPAPWSEQLPVVTQTWSSFGRDGPGTPVTPPADQPFPRAPSIPPRTDRAAAFRHFVSSIKAPGPGSERPRFHFLHSLLPHAPWEYLPSGRRYSYWNDYFGLDRDVWSESPWPALHHYKRYLLQVEFLDQLIGELTAQLRASNLFEQSVVAITADHGVAFRPGRTRRFLLPADLEGGQPLDIAHIPLLIKAPFQQQPEIDEATFSLVGLARRVLELAGADSGALPLPERAPEQPTIASRFAGDVEIPTERERWRQSRITEQASLLGESNDPMAIGVRPELHGHKVLDFPVREAASTFEIDNAWVWDHVDSNQHTVPALVDGAMVPDQPAFSPPNPELAVAVALNGVIEATVRPHDNPQAGSAGIRALLPGDRFVTGFNRVEAFLVTGTAADIQLERLRTVRKGAPPRPQLPGSYALTWNADGRPDGIVHRPLVDVPATWKRTEIVRRDGDLIGFLDGAMVGHGLEVNGWATDLRHPDEPLEIIAFLEGRHVWSGATGLPRPDVAERHGAGHSRSGFAVSPELPPESGRRARRRMSALVNREGFVVFAVSRRQTATRLRFAYRRITGSPWGRETIPVSDGRVLQVEPVGRGFAGAIDVLAKPDRRTRIEGWAADVERHEASRQIIIYRDGEFLVALPAGRTRADVAEHYEDERLMAVGFSGRVPGAPDPATFAERHRVFAIALRGVAVELPIPEGDGAGRQRTLGTQPDVEPP